MESVNIPALRKVCVFFMCIPFIFYLVSCQNTARQPDIFNEAELGQLKLSLDSVDTRYQEPGAEKMVQSVFERIKSDPENPLLARTLRLKSFVVLSKEFPTKAQLDSGHAFARKAQGLALIKNDSAEWALNEVQVGRYHLLRSYWLREHDGLPLATTSLLAAIKILEKEKLTEDLSFAYHWLANATSSGKDILRKKLIYKLRALNYNDSARFPILRAKICNDLSGIYLDFAHDTIKGKALLFRSITILEKLNDWHTLSVVIGNLADLFRQEHNSKRALYYFRLAVKVAHDHGIWEKEAGLNHQIARLFQADLMFDSAIFYSQKSIGILKKQQPSDLELVWQAEIARSYVESGNRKYAERLTHILETELASHTLSGTNISEVFTRLTDLANVYEALGDYKKLSETRDKLLLLGDTLYSRDQLVEVGRIENQYHLQLKNKELEVLQLSLRFQSESSKVRQYVRSLLLGCILITVVGLALVGRLLIQKNRYNKTLAERTAIIERQREELSNSLKDLHRAQAHMLTSEKMVMLGQFTAGVAHELNNPLNFISGGVSVLDEIVGKFVHKNNLPRDEAKLTSLELSTILTNINNGVDRMTAIVAGLQIFSNPREALTDDSETDVCDCLDASLILIKSKLDSQLVHVKKSYTSAKVHGHSGRISQVFINLIDNAIHAMSVSSVKHRQLTITMSATPHEVNISFEDNGIGIPEDVRSDIFNAFFTTKETGQGTGLGLFICYNIVKELAGRISFESEVGRGTTFTVSLPRTKF